jgi:hypothetical protein
MSPQSTAMHAAAMGQVREHALEHVLETLFTTSKDVQSCLLLASTSKSLNKLVGEGSCWRRFFAEAVQVRRQDACRPMLRTFISCVVFC